MKKVCTMKLVMAAAMFVCMRKVEVQAATPSVAGPKQMADGTLFDAAYYAATYPDVAAAFGTDEAMLYNHYVLCGKAEVQAREILPDTIKQGDVLYPGDVIIGADGL